MDGSRAGSGGARGQPASLCTNSWSEETGQVITASNASAAIAALQALGYRPRAPVRAEDFADEDIRTSWREDKGLTVFWLCSPSYPGTDVDLLVDQPFELGEAWSRRLEALLDDGTTVRVVGIEDLRALKASVGRPKDFERPQRVHLAAGHLPDG